MMTRSLTKKTGKKKPAKKAVKKTVRKKASKKKSTKKTGDKNDPVKDYALKVRAGQIVAGPSVRNACKRHLDDLKNASKRGLVWDLAKAKRAIDFFHKVLRLSGNDYEGKPFILNGWESFVVGSIFGWVDIQGYRRFSMAFIETGKGSGKSPIAAGIGLYMLTADGEKRAEIYAAATKRDQAHVLFRDAVAMVSQSPALIKRIAINGTKDKEYNLAYHKTSSFFRPISSEDRGIGQSGPRPHCGLLDEIHEHATNAMVEFTVAGFKNRKQALAFMITNSGHNKKSPCGGYHDYAKAVAAGDKTDDSFFSFVCDLDEGDDPFKDEKCWPKVNPSLPDIPGYKYLRRQVREAKGMPSKESLVRRLNFCEWVEASDPWISRDLWMAVQKKLDIEKFKDQHCAAAIDLSGKTDLTSLTAIFRNVAHKYAFTWYWTPEDTLPERAHRDRVPDYMNWAKDGYLNAVPGKSIDYAFIARQIKTINDITPIDVLAFDRWRINDLIRELDEIDVDCYLAEIVIDDDGNEIIQPVEGVPTGIAMLPHGQGFKDMSPAVDDLEESIMNCTIDIDQNPVTTMCAANAVLQTDPAGNRKFTKQKSNGRIDGMISLSMANRVSRFIGEIADDGNFNDFLSNPVMIV